MILFKKMTSLTVCAFAVAVCLTGTFHAQTRDRVVKTTSSQPTNLPPALPTEVDKTQPLSSSRPTLTNKIIVVKPETAAQPLVKKTVSSSSVSAAVRTAGKSLYASATANRLDGAIKARYGLRYRYGTAGPYTYDCSGFVWSVFKEAGMDFVRGSARGLWADSESVTEDEKYKFGTLVFLNRLGHVGIVADENGFYHASSSKGITYSPFKGYWQKRIVGFKKLRTNTAPAAEE